MSEKNIKTGKESDAEAEKVVVAVRASTDIPKTALIWALTHVVQPGYCITLLVIAPSQTFGRRLWGFPRLAGDCANGNWKFYSGATLDNKSDITDLCSQMILQLQGVYDPKKINVKIKIVSGSPCGAVAEEAKKIHANWVVLDKQLKHELKRCMEELQCNIVVMKHCQPKVLRLNLVGSSSPKEEDEKNPRKNNVSVNSIRKTDVTPVSSPEMGTSFTTTTEIGTSSVSSSDPGTSFFFNAEDKKVELLCAETNNNHESNESSSDAESEILSPSMRFGLQPWMKGILSRKFEAFTVGNNDKSHQNSSTDKALVEKFSKLDRESRRIGMLNPNPRSHTIINQNVREAISFSRNGPLGPPPLCSICQHKGPVFGKPPRWFGYGELELATGGFSEANFLAEGGFGSVHRGVLPDGQAIAVKQHKLASSQGDIEFCSEVEVLSCAQHRNVVMLIGYCTEDGRRLLVYEYICNGSLDSHLWGHNEATLEWSARQKIAVGAARGLRYLHEECRVGCIVHRDMRPNNILITHDFEPLVGDFGLARWQPDGDAGVETRVIGTFGYLAPEYAQSGQITEKADVYSFGVVLLELVSGRKAVDLNQSKGQQCLTEWARPLLEENATEELMDLELKKGRYSKPEVHCMLHAASLCICRDPRLRPRMSQVLRILEGDMVMMEPCDTGNCSGRINNFNASMGKEKQIRPQVAGFWGRT